MKKTYEAPSMEVIAFNYREQVVAASPGGCANQYIHTGSVESRECDDPQYNQPLV